MKTKRLNIERFNQMPAEEAESQLLTCCHSNNWVKIQTLRRPYVDKQSFLIVARETWFALDEKDWLEAFAAHPKIGDINSLKRKFKSTRALATDEQSGTHEAGDVVLNELAKLNLDYENKFGFIFIVSATGKTAEQMLQILKERIVNTRQEELRNACIEQMKITELRLEKFL